MSRTLYEIRLLYRPLELIAVLAAWGLIGLAHVDVMLDLPAGPRVGAAVAMLETGLPLLAIFAVGHTASVEWEERTVELSLSYQGGAFGVLGHRLAVAGTLFAGVATLTVAAFAAIMPEMLRPGPANAFQVAVEAVPPALLVGSLSLLGSIVGRNYLSGLVTALALWGVELLLPGRLTGPLYLFQASRPLPELASCLTTNRIGLCLLAAVVFGLALAFWSWRERMVS